MFDNIRLLLKLRPVAERLRQIMKMRFSFNMIFQILALIIQGYNQIEDILSPENKEIAALVIGVLQAIVALWAHYKNPDGTPVTTAYISPKSKKGGMTTLSILMLVMLLTLPLSAQEPADLPDQIFGAGMSWATYTPPQLSGNMLYAKRMIEETATYSFTFVDVISSEESDYFVSPVFTTGIAQKLPDFTKLPIYAVGSIGILTGGSAAEGKDTASFAYTYGFAVPLKFPLFGLGSKGWKIIPNVRGVDSLITDPQPIFGCLIAWGR